MNRHNRIARGITPHAVLLPTGMGSRSVELELVRGDHDVVWRGTEVELRAR
jgi:hypothetical protein